MEAQTDLYQLARICFVNCRSLFHHAKCQDPKGYATSRLCQVFPRLKSVSSTQRVTLDWLAQVYNQWIQDRKKWDAKGTDRSLLYVLQIHRHALREYPDQSLVKDAYQLLDQTEERIPHETHHDPETHWRHLVSMMLQLQGGQE